MTIRAGVIGVAVSSPSLFNVNVSSASTRSDDTKADRSTDNRTFSGIPARNNTDLFFFAAAEGSVLESDDARQWCKLRLNSR